jgi:hypothetical protein
MKVEWHFTMKEITPVPVEVVALVEVLDEHRAMVVKAKAVVKDMVAVTHNQLR